MNGSANMLLRVCLTVSVVIFSIPVAYAAVPLLPLCSWPVESTGQGFLNVATQDTNTTYWFMPIDTSRWKSVTIRGTYPNARLFNYATYGPTGLLIDTLLDEDIVPDNGNANPFTTATAAGSNTYTVTVGPGSAGASNLLSTGGSRLIYVIYRVIVPDKGLDRGGGVDVPSVTLVAQDGTERRLRACPFASAESSLGGMVPILIASGFSQAANFLQKILDAAHQRTSLTGSCNTASQPLRPAALKFGPAPGTDFFPNPPTAYLQTPNECFHANEVIVVRGKALVFPKTYVGGSISDPAFDGQIQARYWSMCNNDGVFPYPVIACAGDFQTTLDKDQYYTYVVSTDPAPADTNWLPWGPTNLPVTLILRSISFDPQYETIPSDYYPQGVICDKTVLTAQGWQGCFTAAGVKVATGP
jgi:hypothetical protein